MSTWWGDSKNMEKIEFSRWLFEGRLRQGKNMLPDGLNWLCYFAGSSKSHHENSISCIFLESPNEKQFEILERLFVVFHHSRNIPCIAHFHPFFTMLIQNLSRRTITGMKTYCKKKSNGTVKKGWAQKRVWCLFSKRSCLLTNIYIFYKYFNAIKWVNLHGTVRRK